MGRLCLFSLVKNRVVWEVVQIHWRFASISARNSRTWTISGRLTDNPAVNLIVLVTYPYLSVLLNNLIRHETSVETRF